MRTFLAIVVSLIVFLVAAGAVIYFTGNVLTVIGFLGEPRHGWEPSLKAPAPDYANASAWAALPGKASPADFVPSGASPPPKDPPVDVFFIHPTGYMHGADWNSPLDPNSQTEENTKWMLANQASAFNGCCAVYAPRYREASIYTYIAKPPPALADKVMDLAYGDVARAFRYFLDHYSRGRPFIIASHSQGTFHALRLIREQIDGTPLASEMVAAYVIGGHITDKDVAALKSIHPCTSETGIHCIVHWMTYGDGAPKDPTLGDAKFLCTNPLGWQRDGGRAAAGLNKGAIVPSGRFQMGLPGMADRARGIEFAPLAAPLKGWTWAECRAGLLFVADQSGGPLGRYDLGGKNYHGLDYPLFYMDIRENAKARVASFLTANAAEKAPGVK